MAIHSTRRLPWQGTQVCDTPLTPAAFTLLFAAAPKTYVPLNSTCRDEETHAQLKVMSFRASQIAHKMAHAPTKAWCLRCFLSPFNQWVNIWFTFNGIGKLKTTLISLHKNLAFWQLKKKYCIVSLRLQQQHFKLPFHRRLAKLLLVRVTPSTTVNSMWHQLPIWSKPEVQNRSTSIHAN